MLNEEKLLLKKTNYYSLKNVIRCSNICENYFINENAPELQKKDIEACSSFAITIILYYY